jgi:hypothetical protein
MRTCRDAVRRTRSAVLILTALAAATSAAPARQGQDGPDAALIERASRYIEEYERAFAALVSEELQFQSIVGADGRVKKTREPRADFLLIKTVSDWAQVFRDIIEVDSKAVRDRDERLRKLFLENPRTAVVQANAIASESRRHNIGVNRQGNSPLLPLLFLHPRNRARSRLISSADRNAFEEVDTPSLLGTRRSILGSTCRRAACSSLIPRAVGCCRASSPRSDPHRPIRPRSP